MKVNHEAIQQVLTTHDGGIHKRIDENRELLELLNDKAPELLLTCPWVKLWIKSQDDFLTSLASLTEKPCFFKLENDFPRPWPIAK